MAILGYNTKGAATAGTGVGQMTVSKYTLAAAGTLNELHGWVGGGSSSVHVIWCIYSDVAGVPTTRLAYTAPLAFTGADVELSQSGFSVPLAAGDYWLGFTCDIAGGNVYRENAGGTSASFVSGAAYNPPANPFGGGYGAGARKYSVWAVVGAAGGGAAAFVPQVAIL